MKKKTLITIALAVLLIALVGLGVFFLVKHFEDKPDTGITTPLHDNLPDGNGEEVTVILLAGQSNAAGCSRDEYLKKNVSPEKYAEYEAGYDNVYINYFATGTNQSNGFVTCGGCQGEAGGFFGPELGLAEKLHETYPERKFFIVKYAWGGSNLYEQWRSPSSGPIGDLYRNFVAYANNSIQYLESKNYNVKIEAMCWMQGESDSIDKGIAQKYEKNLSNFIADIRKEFSDYASNDGIAFVDAYIADSIHWKHYMVLNKSKQVVADAASNNVVIDTIAHGLSVANEPEGEPDLAHYDSLSEIKLGHLFAQEASRFFD